ncbi:MAG: TetR/AcrR family transcriptional regulator [Bacteroidales bacterium]|nr:TetR/AcrR family transcriptional regulator [Bacteroidales bacterium]
MSMSSEQLQAVSQLFMKYGIRNTSMDDVARELGVSKKTLYQWFQSKDELLDKIIDAIIYSIHDKDCDEQLNRDSENAIDVILNVITRLAELGKHVNPIFFWELKKYYPVQAKKLNDFRVKHIREKIIQNLQRGITEGVYRKNINIEIVSFMYVNIIEHFPDLINSEQLKKYSVDTVLREIYLFHLHAIVNEKGRQYLRTKINQIEL